MLDKTDLKNKLSEFCDPDYASFAGFPTSRDIAREKWAQAFYAYINKADESFTGVPPGHSSMSMTSVESDFNGDLDLTQSTSAATAAADFAGAWQKAVKGITAGSTTSDGTATYKLFQGFTDVSSQYDTLLSTLTGLFSNPTTATSQRLLDISTAFHTATTGIKGKITKQVGTSSPVIVDVTLV